MQRAKRVVEQQYAVVGVLEDMNSTLLALENYIPRFFSGALQLYWGERLSYRYYFHWRTGTEKSVKIRKAT